MLIAKVIRPIVCTHKIPQLEGLKLLEVEIESTGKRMISIDNVHAGSGDRVIINNEGQGLRQALNTKAPVYSAIVGFVDSVNL